MRKPLHVFWLPVCVWVVGVPSAYLCRAERQVYFESEEDIMIIGLFDLHDGSECDVVRPGSIEQMHIVSWTLQHLNSADNSTAKIGFKAYDTCSTMKTALGATIESLLEPERHGNSCLSHNTTGYIGPTNRRISSEISTLLQNLNLLYQPIVLNYLYPEIKALVSVLGQLKWRQVALLSVSESLGRSFLNLSEGSKICVAISIPLPSVSDSNEYRRILSEIYDTSIRVVVILGSDIEVQHLLRTAEELNFTDYYWLVAGVVANVLTDKLGDMAARLLLAQTTRSRFPDLTENYLKSSDAEKYPDLLEEYLTTISRCDLNFSGRPDGSTCRGLKEHVVDPHLEATVEATIKLANTLRQEHSNFSKMMLDISESSQDMDVTLWSYQPKRKKRDSTNFVQVGYYEGGRLLLDIKNLNILQPVTHGWYRVPEFSCDFNCSCLNKRSTIVEEPLPPVYKWRRDTWVTVCVTIAIIGICAALAIMVYIFIHMCHQEVPQGFSLVILGGVIFGYFSIVPYALADSETTCTLRVVTLGLGYCAIFAPIVARSLMLATSDIDGLPGHVSGIVQCSLYIAMCSVQVAMSIEYWCLNTENHVVVNQAIQSCSIKRTRLMGFLTYAMVLFGVWVVLAPFCIRIRRSYREGLLFQIASIATLVTWIIWLLLLCLSPTDLQEPVVCFGMVATASLILIIVFVPRLYKMAAVVAMDPAHISLRPVSQHESSSLTTVKGLATIYESVNHAYAPEPTSGKQVEREIVRPITRL